ncbi:hypothetical protein ACH50O_11700 [Methylomonas sp. 2BW1-5-20]|uniref:hypothetical protein n=1 Tax=Methylomonas sp. 2BW1-5-20 TaxID=3376686 RepID=UPI0040520B32
MTARRRLSILVILRGVPTCTMHEVDLKRTLADDLQAVDTETLRDDLRWLHSRNMVLATQPGGVWFVTLTSKGDDARQGLINEPGLLQPELK